MNVLKVLRACFAVACLCLISGAGCADEYRTVVDSRGGQVQVPAEINRVVTISDGLVEGVMTVLGVEDTLVGIGSGCVSKVYEYTYPTVKGEDYRYEKGMDPVTYLNPQFVDLPLVSMSGALNYETLASLDPDVIIARAGDCTLRIDDEASMNKTIDTIESLGLTLVVIRSPNTFDEPDLSTISDEIRIMGQVFGKEDEAVELANYLEEEVEFVRARTKDIQDEEKPEVLVLGLASKAREAGGVGYGHGLNSIESYLVEDVVNARNAYQEPCLWNIMSPEHVLESDPDVIILNTFSGYHPPRELYEAPYYQNLQEMDAIKNKRVAALRWSPCNCDMRLEYPIDIMVIAKAAYPERFEDVDLGEWLLDFYMNVYNVDRETAVELRSAQWMDWVLEEGN
jgi:iron complex transport system substrate-binding protein